MLINKPKPINKDDFTPTKDNLEVKYGLPASVQFCQNCVYSNQKPNSASEFNHTSKSKKDTVAFSEHGECEACASIKQKQSIDWTERDKELRELCDRYRSKDGSYDCLVPGSGGKDSVFASHLLREKYGMTPLTVTFSPHIYTDWGLKNFSAWIDSGFNNYLFSPNRLTQRLLTRLALENIFHPFQPFMMGQMYFPPKMAMLHNIKLVFYGENPTDYGNAEEKVSPIKELRYFTKEDNSSETFISGVPIQQLVEDFGISRGDLATYLPVDRESLLDSGIEVHYLGYYLKWHPQGCFYYASEHTGFEPSPERTVGTYSKYSSIDDKVDDLHYFTTFIKFGIGRATYDAAQEVRSGDIDRDEAIALVKKYDGEFPKRFLKELLEYLSIPSVEFPTASKLFSDPIMDENYFELLCDKFRSPHIWKWQNNKWMLRHNVFDDF